MLPLGIKEQIRIDYFLFFGVCWIPTSRRQEETELNQFVFASTPLLHLHRVFYKTRPLGAAAVEFQGPPLQHDDGEPTTRDAIRRKQNNWIAPHPARKKKCYTYIQHQHDEQLA